MFNLFMQCDQNPAHLFAHYDISNEYTKCIGTVTNHIDQYVT